MPYWELINNKRQPPLFFILCRIFTFIDGCCLAELPFSGLQYSWARISNNIHIERKLNRVILYLRLDGSLRLYLLSNFTPLSFGSLAIDYFLLLQFGSIPKSFKFHSMWLKHAGFQALISETWNSIETHAWMSYVYDFSQVETI